MITHKSANCNTLPDLEITVNSYKLMRIPEQHYDCTISNIPDHCEYKERLKSWTARAEYNVIANKGILLFGQYSTGKSGAAAICLKAAATRRKIGLYLSAPMLVEYVFEKTMYNFNEGTTMINRARSVPLLVIDELIIDPGNPHYAKTLESLIRFRMDKKLCTIITTNHTTQELQEHCPSMSAALRQIVEPVEVSGHDFRKAFETKW
ncbi:MAG: hypothetical protein COA78_05660 [Blastopirellula sp.]|nr:MAG: hypothetical protein COA78_05660 [Blastopirellula sp.]